MTEQKSKDWLLVNAIECWLFYFPQHEWAQQYKDLRDAIKQQVQDSDTTSVEEERTQPPSRRASSKTKAQTSQA